jgi:hypothetical protein
MTHEKNQSICFSGYDWSRICFMGTQMKQISLKLCWTVGHSPPTAIHESFAGPSGPFTTIFEVVDPFHADGFVRVACQPNGGGRVVGQVERAIAFGAGGFRQ